MSPRYHQVRSTIQVLGLLTGALLILVGCGQGQTSTGSAGSTILGEYRDTNSTDATTEETSGDFITDGLDSAYLFEVDEADAIAPVLPFKTSAGSVPEFTRSSRYGRVERAIEDMLDRGMRLQGLRPGRNFEIQIAADDMVNAFASDQTLVFHTGSIDSSDALAMAFVVCHEAAHSTRNHGVRIQEDLDIGQILSDPSVRRLNDDIESYLGRTVRNGRYFHRESAYRPLRERWDQSFGSIYNYRKRLESEADVIGGKICANLGFTREEIVEGSSRIFARFRAGESVAIDRDGTYRLDGITKEDLTDALFPLGSHPTGEEREAQIKRVRTIFDGANDNRNIADNWINEYTGAAGGSGLLGLTDFAGFGLVDEASGQVISINPGCGHDHGTSASEIIFQ